MKSILITALLLLSFSFTNAQADFTVVWTHPDPAAVDGFNVHQRDNTDPAAPGAWTTTPVAATDTSLDVLAGDGAYCIDVTSFKNITDPAPQTIESAMSTTPVCFTQTTFMLESPAAVDVNAPAPVGGSFVIITK